MKSIKLGSKEYFPSKLVCVGKNYAEHIKEMGDGGSSKEPTIFLKPNSAISYREEVVRIPSQLGLLHHEVELCFVVGKQCKEVSQSEAKKNIAGYAVGVDFTLRNMQAEAKKVGGPWDLAKGFDSSAPLGEFSYIPDSDALDIRLLLNGTVRQHSNTSKMVFSPSRILSYTSNFMTLEEGDVFMCGTPEGVGEVKDGDEIVAEIEGLKRLKIRIVR